jgi:hypothetical protein
VLDLGRSDRSNAGLITFKNRLGGAESLLSYSRRGLSSRGMNLFIENHEDWKLRLVKGLISGVPAPVLSAVGDVFYKHVG